MSSLLPLQARDNGLRNKEQQFLHVRETPTYNQKKSYARHSASRTLKPRRVSLATCLSWIVTLILVVKLSLPPPPVPEPLPPKRGTLLTDARDGVKVGFTTLLFGNGSRFAGRLEENAINPYQVSISLKEDYARRWGYPFWRLDRPILYGPQRHNVTAMYSKQALVLEILLAELQKPEAERLEWIFYFDADTVIANANVPLETFVPPNSTYGNSTFLLITRDPWGTINAGAFAIRVSEHSVKYLLYVISWPVFTTDDLWMNGEQTSMAYVAHLDQFIDGVAIVPDVWFNADPFFMFDSSKFNCTWLESYKFGDFMVHFMDSPKYGFSELALSSVGGQNETLALAFNKTRYAGLESPKLWYEAESKRRKADRRSSVKDFRHHTFEC